MKDNRTKKKCLFFYLKNHSIEEIIKLVPGVSKKTLYNWRQKDKWDELKQANLSDADKIDNGLSELVIKLINTAKQKPDKETLANLEYAVKICDEHQKALLPK